MGISSHIYSRGCRVYMPIAFNRFTDDYGMETGGAGRWLFTHVTYQHLVYTMHARYSSPPARNKTNRFMNGMLQICKQIRGWNKCIPKYKKLAHASSSLAHKVKIKKNNFHFLLCMTFVHMSTNAVFASLSGNKAIDSTALSANSCARARVCSSPSLCDTISFACSMTRQ